MTYFDLVTHATVFPLTLCRSRLSVYFKKTPFHCLSVGLTWQVEAPGIGCQQQQQQWQTHPTHYNILLLSYLKYEEALFTITRDQASIYYNHTSHSLKGSSLCSHKREQRMVYCYLLQLLLGAEVGSVTAGLLAAVGGPGVQAGVALAADHLK